jgi:phage tail sheath protein FI
MPPNVGVNVLEVDGLASPTIAAAPTSIAGFVGIAERGPVDDAVRISSADQFHERFGATLADSYMGLAVEGFFLNGGANAYITRVTAPASRPAGIALLDRSATTGAPTLQVRAGYRGEEDPGTWGQRIVLDVRDDPRGTTTVSGAALAGATSVVLTSLAGVRVGSVLRFTDGSATSYVTLTGIDRATRTVSWTGPIVTALSATTTVATAEFRLVVRYRESATAPEQVVEDWRNLSMQDGSPDYVVTRVNHAFTGSRYITVADASGTTAAGLENPAVTSSQALTGAAETAPGVTEYQGSSAARSGLHAFDTDAVQLIAIPDAHTLGSASAGTIARSAIDYCAARGDCMYVGSAPNRALRGGVSVARTLSDYASTDSAYTGAVKTYSAPLQGAKAYGALYTPWIRVSDPAASGPAPTRFIPPEGHVMGMYARTDQERGIWKAPAGVGAQLRGALDVAATFTDVQHTDLVRNGFVNGVRYSPGVGITVAASRTLSTDTRWWYVNVRLLFNFVKSSLREGLRWVRQEPHSDALRRTVKFNVVTPFLLGLWRRGAFGADPADQVFSVKCDAENNPPQEVDLGNFWIEVYFYPVRPAETVMIVVGQQPSGSSAGEG